MVPGAQGDTPEVVGRYLNIVCDVYSDTTNVKYALSCTHPSKNRSKRGRGAAPLSPCVLYLAAGLRRSSDFLHYHTKQDKITLARVGNYTSARPTAASGDSLYYKYSCHRHAEFKSRCSESTIVQHLVARCVGYFRSALILGVSLVGFSASCTKSRL